MPPIQRMGQQQVNTDLLQLPDWLTNLFPAPAPAAPAGASPPPTGPNPYQTTEQNAQRVIERFWRWQAAGAHTVPSPTEKDPKTGQPVPIPVDPETGQPDPTFPDITEIDAAEALLTRKQTNDPAAVQQAKDQAKATLDETKARTAQIQAAMAKKAEPPATVEPGQGVRQPDGTYIVPVPLTKAANSQTPAQAHAARLDEIRVTYAAQADAERKKLENEIATGAKLPEAAAKELDYKYKELAARAQAERDTQLKQYEHDLAQPNLDRTFNLAQQTETANEQNMQQQRDQAAAQGQADVLKEQAAQGQSNLDMLAKAGTHASMASIKLAYGPLQQAFQIMQGMVQKRQVPASAIPTPQAPVPARTNGIEGGIPLGGGNAAPQAPAPYYPPSDGRRDRDAYGQAA